MKKSTEWILACGFWQVMLYEIQNK